MVSISTVSNTTQTATTTATSTTVTKTTTTAVASPTISTTNSSTVKVSAAALTVAKAAVATPPTVAKAISDYQAAKTAGTLDAFAPVSIKDASSALSDSADNRAVIREMVAAGKITGIGFTDAKPPHSHLTALSYQAILPARQINHPLKSYKKSQQSIRLLSRMSLPQML